MDFLSLRKSFKKAFTPVTIMLVPHSKSKPLNFKIPFIGIVSTMLLSFMGTIYVFTIAVRTFEYYRMKRHLNYYSEQFSEVKDTISSLKKAEAKFTELFSHQSKDDIFKKMDADKGSIDIDDLKDEINASLQNVEEIKKYLLVQRDIYVSTPRGLPTEGIISSRFGRRVNPITSRHEFHSGVDISTASGNPVRATADGVISFSRWSAASGNLVVIEHGHGYSTFNAHNKLNAVKVGQKVKRGDVIAYVGSTGRSTGPHVHYEIHRNGKPIDPLKEGEKSS